MLGKRIARRLHLDRNPLRRRSDRIEAWLTIFLAMMILLVGPILALQASRSAQREAERAAAWNRLHRFQVDAVLLEDAVRHAQYAEAGPPAPGLVPARWTGPNGTPHTGSVPARPDRRAGDPVQIWTDAHGNPMPPPSHQHPSRDAFVAGMFALFGVIAASAGFRLLVLRRLNRRRMELWQTQWMFVEPRWSGRR